MVLSNLSEETEYIRPNYYWDLFSLYRINDQMERLKWITSRANFFLYTRTRIYYIFYNDIKSLP